jgi:hypothetical protein
LLQKFKPDAARFWDWISDNLQAKLKVIGFGVFQELKFVEGNPEDNPQVPTQFYFKTHRSLSELIAHPAVHFRSI